MDVIVNNIVNVNIVGFKEFCVEFGDVYVVLLFLGGKIKVGDGVFI